MKLRQPVIDMLPGYVDALKRGWSPATMDPSVGQEHLKRIAEDQVGFLESLTDPKAKGPPIRLPDGSTVPRLPGYILWMWDGQFCGTVGFRWQPGTDELPPHVLGHIGYSVVPWKRRRGYATQGLGMVLPLAARQGLASVEITTDLDNIASQKVIEANQGRLIEQFPAPPSHGGHPMLRYRIDLAGTGLTQ